MCSWLPSERLSPRPGAILVSSHIVHGGDAKLNTTVAGIIWVYICFNIAATFFCRCSLLNCCYKIADRFFSVLAWTRTKEGEARQEAQIKEGVDCLTHAVTSRTVPWSGRLYTIISHMKEYQSPRSRAKHLPVSRCPVIHRLRFRYSGHQLPAR